ncbi:hypothetical protein [Selenomonas sp. AB3002]
MIPTDNLGNIHRHRHSGDELFSFLLVLPKLIGFRGVGWQCLSQAAVK